MNKLDYDSILTEWSWRSDGGTPFPFTPQRINALKETLLILKYPADWSRYIISEVEKNDRQKAEDSKYSHRGNGIYVISADKDKDIKTVTKFKKDIDSGKYSRMTSTEADRLASGEKEEPAKVVASPEQKPKEKEKPKEAEKETPNEQEIQAKKEAERIEKTRLTKSEYEIEGETEPPPPTKDESGLDNTQIKKYENKYSQNNNELSSYYENGFTDSVAAPGNKGSMYNEISSILMSDLYLDNSSTTEKQAYDALVKLESNGTLAQENNTSSTRSGDITSADTKPYKSPGDSNELISKRLIAVKSAKRKAKVINKAKSALKWKKTNQVHFFGDSQSLNRMKSMLKNSNGVVDQEGNRIPEQEWQDLINSSGGGSNPSDTATIIIDKKTGLATPIFYSDKDSLSAIIAQSSFNKETADSDPLIDELVTDKKLDKSSADDVKAIKESYNKTNKSIEDKLGSVVQLPASYLSELANTNTSAKELVNISKQLSKGSNPSKYFDKAVKTKFNAPNKKLSPTDANPRKTTSDYLPSDKETYTDEEMFQAFTKWASDPMWKDSKESLPAVAQSLLSRLNTKIGGPDINKEIEKIRKETINNQEKMIKDLDTQHKIDIDGKKVGMGTYLESQNIWNKGHLNAITGKGGVFGHKDMFEVNNGGVAITGDILSKALDIDNKNDFITNFEVGTAEEQLSSQKLVTGSRKLVYALTKSGKRFPIMEKRQRSKQGILGKLDSVYKWAPELQSKIKELNK